MALADSLLPEFDQELATTRRVLEACPADRADWKPHPKSFSVGELGLHIANLLTWAGRTLEATEYDVDPPDGSAAPAPVFESVAANLTRFDQNSAAARASIANATDEDLKVHWTLKHAGRELFTLPRLACLRSFILNHLIHHRGQLTVYLRQLEVPLPQVYGPTADAPMF